MALVPPLDATPEEVKAALAPVRHSFSVAVHACGNAFAVGAIVRVAHNFLAREIIIVGDEPHYAKASMGMEKYETIVKVADDDAFFAHAAGRPVWALEKEHARRSLYAGYAHWRKFHEGSYCRGKRCGSYCRQCDCWQHFSAHSHTGDRTRCRSRTSSAHRQHACGSQQCLATANYCAAAGKETMIRR